MMISVHPNRAPLLCALTWTLLHSASGFAQTPPNAGQILRELRQQPHLNTATTGPSVEGEEKPLNATTAISTSFAVKAFLFTGNEVIAGATLQSLVKDLEGDARTLKDLDIAAARITAYYREQGYPVARAYLPAQEIEGGVVTIAIVEGRISAQQLNNQSLLSDERAKGYLEHVRGGASIRTDQIDRGLLLLNDTPGVSNARATLQPGASVGTSDLVVQLERGATYNGSVDFDNYGNRYVGEYRISSTVNINSPLNIGDVLTANVLTSGAGLNYGRLAYQLPVGSDGLRIGAAYFKTRYELGEEFKSLDAHGDASSASVFAAYPFIRSQLTNLNGTLSWEQKDLSDSVDATSTTIDKRAKLITAGIFGSQQDAFGGGGISNMSLSVILGQLDIKSPSALIIDNASAKTNGNYARWSYNLARLQRLTDSNTLYLTVYGQEASKNLDSSEKFALGGATGIRAYPQGEGIGDEGVLATIELRHNFTASLLGTLFYDTGSIKINHTPFGPTTANSLSLAGAGIGLNALFSQVQIKASIAWRTSNQDPTSIPASEVHTPTLWVQASIGF